MLQSLDVPASLNVQVPFGTHLMLSLLPSLPTTRYLLHIIFLIIDQVRELNKGLGGNVGDLALYVD